MKTGALKILGVAVVGTFLLSGCPQKEDSFDCKLRDGGDLPMARVSNETEWFGCIGYLHGRHRAWQLDHLRRIALGKRSEVFGSAYAEADGFLRLLRFREESARLVRELPARERGLLERYASGVQVGVEQTLQENGRAAREFRHFNYRPDPWTPEDSIAILLIQAFNNSQSSYETEMDESKALQRFGALAPRLFVPDGLPWDVSILKAGEYETTGARKRTNPAGLALGPENVNADRVAAYLERVMPRRDFGSNSWAVGASRSATGNALFANDPHVDIAWPSFWFNVVIKDPEFTSYGAFAPGIPFIASGTNGHVAWGLTTSFVDVAELFLFPQDEAVRALPPYSVVLPVQALPGHATVLRWSGYALTGDDIVAFLNLRKAKTIEEMDRRISEMHVPSWNLVYADRSSQLGYRTTGRFPRHVGPEPFGMQRYANLDAVPRWDYLTAEESPHVMRPARDWIATANNRQWAADSRLTVGRGHVTGFRAYRIEQMLAATEKHSVETFKQAQCDVKNTDAEFYLPKMMARIQQLGKPASVSQEVWDTAMSGFATWDQVASTDCRLCGIYHWWRNRLRDPGLSWGAAFRALDEPQLQARMDEMLLTGFENAVRAYTDAHGTAFPTWGETHRASFLSPLGIPELAPGGSIGTAGDKHTVSPGSSFWNGSFHEHDAGASHRLIVEMTPEGPKVWRALAGPNSARHEGHVDDADSPWRRWADCQYEELKWR